MLIARVRRFHMRNLPFVGKPPLASLSPCHAAASNGYLRRKAWRCRSGLWWFVSLVFLAVPPNVTTASSQQEGPFEIVFLLDSSQEVLIQGLWAAQKEMITDAICGTSAFIPADGSVAIAVVKFGNFSAETVVGLTTIESYPAPLCQQIDDLNEDAGDPDLLGALEDATAIFDASDAASSVQASARLVVVLSESFPQSNAAIMAEAEGLRTRSVPARICATDIDTCTISTDKWFDEMANAAGSPLRNPEQVTGEASCENLTVIRMSCLCSLKKKRGHSTFVVERVECPGVLGVGRGVVFGVGRWGGA